MNDTSSLQDWRNLFSYKDFSRSLYEYLQDALLTKLTPLIEYNITIIPVKATRTDALLDYDPLFMKSTMPSTLVEC